MRNTEFQLQERIKELQCLYELSRIALQNENNLGAILSKTILILPKAMQHPEKAEARITVGKEEYHTPKFGKSDARISARFNAGNSQRGVVEVGYRIKNSSKRSPFLKEERNLIRAVANELSLLIKRTVAEQEKQSLRNQLKQLERLAFVGELSAGIAHELNEPLGRILGFAQLIKKAGALSAQQEQDIERIIKASLYTREIIKKLMIFSRQMPQQITPVNLNEIVSNTLYFIDVRLQNSSIELISKLDPALPDIQADAVQMSQVLVNLATNALHAMPNGGKLTIVTRKRKGEVSLTVKDTGHGITTEVRKKIFEPFFSTKPVGQGTGLGLSVVQGIVTAHHGKITVTSVVGKGTKFELIFPFKQPRRRSGI
jgi:signal transduction histidine kinase